MKLPITEKFLWNLHALLEATEGWLHAGDVSLKRFMEPGMYNARRRYQKQKGRREFTKLVSYLKHKEYIETPEIEGRKGFILTQKGKDKIISIQHKFIKRKKREDKRWEMILFDIPEKERRKRDLLRDELKKLGYQQLQKSIWVSPYDVLEDTQKLIGSYEIIEHTRLLIIEEIPIKPLHKP